MSWWQDAIGLIGALGIGGYAGNLLDRKHTDREAEKVRDHTTSEARAQRRWERRRDVYRDLSKHFERIRAMANWTEPIIGPVPEPPKIDADDEWFALSADMSVAASDEVIEAAQLIVTKTIEFRYAADEWRDSNQPGYRGEDSKNLRLELEAKRKALLNALTNAQMLMRDELDLM